MPWTGAWVPIATSYARDGPCLMSVCGLGMGGRGRKKTQYGTPVPLNARAPPLTICGNQTAGHLVGSVKSSDASGGKAHRVPVPWDVDATRIMNLQVIFKTVERCNINCSYCYYFNGGDRSYRERPARITEEIVSSVAEFLREGVLDLGIPSMQIVFHGGEPLMQGKRRFDRMCGILRTSLSATPATVTFAIQTNGTLLDDEWCDILHTHGVAVGVSLDGTREINDRFRIDHRARSTYDATVRGITALIKHGERRGSDLGLGCLTVIDPRNDYAGIYRHLSRDIGFRRMGFLLPDCSHDSFHTLGTTPERVGEVLIDIFEAWRSDPIAEITNVSRVLDFFRAGGVGRPARDRLAQLTSAGNSVVGNQIIVIHSDGSLSVDDSLMPAYSWWERTAPRGEGGITLRQWLKAPFFSEVSRALRTLPLACNECAWQRFCQGGDLENRFSTAAGFDRESVFCGGLSRFYNHVSQYLLRHGYPADVMLAKLCA